jgi:hypothetical protein
MVMVFLTNCVRTVVWQVVERHCETQNEASFSFHHEKQNAASQQNCDFYDVESVTDVEKVIDGCDFF